MQTPNYAATKDLDELLKSVRGCQICTDLPLGPRPIVQIDPSARVLIAGQAPGRITHAKGIPFDDPSGVRLREWMGIDRATFYDASKIAILPMGFCFPGTGTGGDLPPRAECEAAWRQRLLAQLPKLETTLVIGKYALDWHMPEHRKLNVTNTVGNWADTWPQVLPLPHPSPRNNRWLKNNLWFERDVLPKLREHIQKLLK